MSGIKIKLTDCTFYSNTIVSIYNSCCPNYSAPSPFLADPGTYQRNLKYSQHHPKNQAEVVFTKGWVGPSKGSIYIEVINDRFILFAATHAYTLCAGEYNVKLEILHSQPPPLPIPSPACQKIWIKMHTIKSRLGISLEIFWFEGVCVCALFSMENLQAEAVKGLNNYNSKVVQKEECMSLQCCLSWSVSLSLNGAFNFLSFEGVL